MANRHIVAIQDSFDNEKRFSFVLVKETPFTEEEVLWSVFSYSRAYRYGRGPEVWTTREIDDSLDLRDLVYAPDSIVEYASWPHRLQDDNPYPRKAIDLLSFYQKEMTQARKRVEAYTKEWASEQYITVDDRTKRALSGNALDVLWAFLPGYRN
jgi:hypothetical protein